MLRGWARRSSSAKAKERERAQARGSAGAAYVEEDPTTLFDKRKTPQRTRRRLPTSPLTDAEGPTHTDAAEIGTVIETTESHVSSPHGTTATLNTLSPIGPDDITFGLLHDVEQGFKSAAMTSPATTTTTAAAAAAAVTSSDSTTDRSGGGPSSSASMYTRLVPIDKHTSATALTTKAFTGVCHECNENTAICWHHCLDCDLILCNVCTRDVHARRSFRNHRVVEFNPVNHRQCSSASGTEKDVEGESISPTRRSSLRSQSSGSSYTDMKISSPEHKHGLSVEVRSAARELRHCRDTWKFFLEKIADLLPVLENQQFAIKRDIRHHFNQLRTELDKRESELLDEMDKINIQRVSPLVKVHDELKSVIGTSKRLIRRARASADEELDVQTKILRELKSSLLSSAAIQLDSESVSSLIGRLQQSQISFHPLSTDSTVKGTLSSAIAKYGHVIM